MLVEKTFVYLYSLHYEYDMDQVMTSSKNQNITLPVVRTSLGFNSI